MKIGANKISFIAGQQNLLRDVSVTMQGGQTTVLLGPNGAGKSTLLRILSGHLKASTGSVRINDEDVGALSLMDRARTLGVLTQNSSLDFPFTTLEVISMGRSPYGVDHEDAVSAEIAKAMAIDENRIYTSLSGGEKQLVQIARVFAQVWDRGLQGFLLLDEPMTALDLKHQQKVVSLLRAFCERGTGQLIVMHDINMAADIADEIILMSAGELVAAGKPELILNDSNLEATFQTPMMTLGNPSRRFFKVRAG